MIYKNPILHFDFSDPDVIRDKDDFYMIASSFNMLPGLPILHSKNLVDWEIINYAINSVIGDNNDKCKKLIEFKQKLLETYKKAKISEPEELEACDEEKKHRR